MLLAFLFLSFGLPLIPVPAKFSFRKPAVENVITSLPVSNTIAAPAKTTSGGEQKVAVQNASDILQGQGFFDQLPVTKILLWGYWLGVAVFAINFLVQLITLLYRAYSRPVIRDGRFRIVELSGDQAPCSFGNNIFINPEKYEWDTYSQIILHEKVHIEQGHSYDILLAELALIFQWFNPFAWFYRKAMEDNLEFLTDNELLANKEVEKSSYQMSLVKVSAPHFPVSLTTNYNQSVLKKRLMMMNAKKSNLNTTWKYLFILPLMLAFVCFLNDPVAYGKTTHAKANINSTQM
ncbi:MAG: M56 family metallopeptidase, partial [Chitinophagaceae bacterium]